MSNSKVIALTNQKAVSEKQQRRSIWLSVWQSKENQARVRLHAAYGRQVLFGLLQLDQAGVQEADIGLNCTCSTGLP